jgi:hypothetical protein
MNANAPSCENVSSSISVFVADHWTNADFGMFDTCGPP